MIRRFVFIISLTLILFTASIVVCAPSAYCGDSPKTSILFWHAMKGHNQGILNGLIEKFQKENPDISVQAQAMLSTDEKMGNDYNALYSRILEGIATKNQPDVAQVYENWTTQFIEINALAPIDSLKNSPSAKERADFFPIFMEANTFNGRLWTMPFNKSIYVLYYNKGLFQKNSLSYPRTWDELREVAKKLTVRESEKPTRYGLVYTPSVDMFGHWLYAYGGEFLSGDNAVFGNEVGVKDLDFWVKLTNDDRSALPSFNAYDDFLSEKGSMLIATTSWIGTLRKKCTFTYGIAPLPEGTIRSYQFAGTNLAVFSSSSDAKKEAALRFITFLTNRENTTFWAINTGYLPVRRSAAKSSEYLEYLKIHPDFSVGIESLQYAKVQPRNPAWESIRGFINDAIYEAVSQMTTAGDALQKAADYSNMLIKGVRGEK